jgi:hypothetical protein
VHVMKVYGGQWKYKATHSQPRHRRGEVVRFTLRVIYRRGNCRGGFVGPAADLRRFDREVNILPVSEIEASFL